MVKFKGSILHAGPVAHVEFSDGWNNSMNTHYPAVFVYTVVAGVVTHKAYSLGEGWPNEAHAAVEVTLDPAQLAAYTAISLAREAARLAEARLVEARTVKPGRMVKIVRGVKVPKGTVGEVFWSGETKFGFSVGIRLANGSKVFTALKNVEVITCEVTRAVLSAAAKAK